MANFFVSGLTNALSEGIQEADKTRLAYAMMSKKMELELQQKQAEQESMYKLQQQYAPGIAGAEETAKLGAQSAAKNIPLDEFQAISKFASEADTAMSSGKPIPSLDAYGIKSTQGQEAALKAQEQVMASRGLMAGAKMYQPTRVKTEPDANGVITQGFQVPATGTWQTPPIRSLEKGRADKLALADAEYATMHQTFQALKNVLPQILTQHPEAATVPLQQLKGWIEKNGFPLDAKTKAFINQIPSIGLQYAKMQTGTVRGWEMAKADIGAFPDLSDSLQSAQEKLSGDMGADTRLTEKIQNAHRFLDPINIQKSPYHPDYVPGGQQQNLDSQSVPGQQPGPSKDPMATLREQAGKELAHRKALRGLQGGK